MPLSAADRFVMLCEQHHVLTPVREWRVCSTRRWAWDFAWPEHKVALEVNGGIWIRGKHSRGKGQVNDFEKWSMGALLGWRVLHTTPDRLETSKTLALVRACLER